MVGARWVHGPMGGGGPHTELTMQAHDNVYIFLYLYGTHVSCSWSSIYDQEVGGPNFRKFPHNEQAVGPRSAGDGGDRVATNGLMEDTPVPGF